ncbi:MAG: ABC transporter ATP-binding protein [Anaerolineae bacterium]|nr:ABC transporter ATP-binding protein [Anaerolineae bacterium]
MTQKLGKMDQPVVRVRNLGIAYETRYGDVSAVKDVTFDIHRGETVGIVGESGCGKSTLAYGMVNYLGRNGKISKGDITFQGQSLVGRTPEELRQLRGNQISMVYQDPMTSLNPVLRIGEQMMEVLTVHRGIDPAEARQKCADMLGRVNMPDPEKVLERYPHQISGGQQQRVVIAMAMLNNPALLIMDEPTTALDVTVEAAALDLVNELRQDFDTAILLISHNMGVIARVSDKVGVMYAGELVEMASVEEIFANPVHPYTQGLIRCLPKLGRSKEGSILYPIRGRVPSPANLPPGCLFEPRCDYAREACRQERPVLRDLENSKVYHTTRCLFSEEIDAAAWVPPPDLVPIIEEGDGSGDELADTILSVDHLQTYYDHPSNSPLSMIGLGKKEYVKAVDDVSFDVFRGKTLGVVGESGCGKSTLIKTLIGLEAKTGGEAEFMSFDIGDKVRKRDLSLIRELQMVFQNPDSTMNPTYSVGKQIERPLRRFKTVPSDQIRDEVIRLLRAVKLDEYYYDRLPRQLSGGEKQRIGIARALAGRPDLVLCDEPVSALDVSVQAAVLNLLLEIQKEFGTTMIFIAHDLSVVRFFSDFIAVMYLGQISEIGPADRIYQPPYHPYTEALLSAVPIADPTAEQKRIRLEGNVPSPLNPPTGCRFHTRCPRRELLPDGGKICETDVPPWRDAGNGHRIFCHVPLEKLKEMDPVIHAPATA